MTFGDRLYGTDSELIWEDAQAISDANGAPVAILERDGWRAICEEPPDDIESAPLEHGWTMVALIDPTETPDLRDLVTRLLPYVEDIEKDPAYKAGAIRKLLTEMRAAIC